MKLATLSLAIAAVAATLASSASAATVALNSYRSDQVYPSDTRALGSATNSATTVDGTNTLVKLTSQETPAGYVPPIGASGNQEKVAPYFSTPASIAAGITAGPIGTLGDLARGSLKLDYLFGSRGATTPGSVANIPAFRLLVGVTPTTVAEVIYEAPYQSINPLPTINPGTSLDNYNIGSGQYYVRYLSANYGEGSNGVYNPSTLSSLVAASTPGTSPLGLTAPTFSDSSPVYGLTVSVGSDAGDYLAYVGDINATFTAVPEPTTLAALAGSGLVGLRRRRRA